MLTEADILPDSAKMAMLLEATGDIRAAERDLRDIENYRDRGVEGSGMLEGETWATWIKYWPRLKMPDLLPLKPNLITGIRQHRHRNEELANAREQVSALLRRYTDFVSGVQARWILLTIHADRYRLGTISGCAQAPREHGGRGRPSRATAAEGGC